MFSWPLFEDHHGDVTLNPPKKWRCDSLRCEATLESAVLIQIILRDRPYPIQLLPPHPAPIPPLLTSAQSCKISPNATMLP